MAKVTCERCGHAIPADPKHPGYPGLHFCAPDEPLGLDTALHRQQHDAAIRAVLEAADEWLDAHSTPGRQPGDDRTNIALATAVRAWRKAPHAHAHAQDQGESVHDG